MSDTCTATTHEIDFSVWNLYQIGKIVFCISVLYNVPVPIKKVALWHSNDMHYKLMLLFW